MVQTQLGQSGREPKSMSSLNTEFVGGAADDVVFAAFFILMLMLILEARTDRIRTWLNSPGLADSAFFRRSEYFF